MSSIIVEAFFIINLEFFAIVHLNNISDKISYDFLFLYYERMSCITPNNILDINLI
jgi:hypothetical protein